ncbi:hypothetical protein CkaCkLH20_02540 [Colletotrichum karsti]|uniref:Alpha/beta hydrolase fold-3 domain-containing protein n=1 Tax=Colletotrichum karsti TaxID=1095194 RepID=A0A9P6IC13_9PEZI|nr:uncharacterized protein CkaCkLH20_02540 [Colletotrichum karsti]KAF9879729.1 hypothetical protein CkaCkLH20_02540 [Colletotrichum karsti]
MLSIEETLALGSPSPEWEEAIKANPVPVGGWTMETDINQLREMIAKVHAMKRAAAPDVSDLPYVKEDIQIPVRDGALLVARIHKPRDIPADGCPVFVGFHGGGWLVGSVEEQSPLCRQFTSVGGIAVNVEYRLAPEHPFPIPVNDCFDAVKWTVENAKSLGGNLQKGFIIGGESAGADLALGVAYLWGKEQTTPPLTGVFSCVSLAVNEEAVPEKYRDHFLSMEQNAHAPILTKEALKLIISKYQPDPKSPVAYPILAPDLGSLMPNTYFQACGLDPLRDCTLVMDQVWKDAGIPTKLDIYPGQPHGFWALFPQLEASKKIAKDTIAGFRWLLA